MPLAEFVKDSVIATKGTPLASLMIITKGSAVSDFGGHMIEFKQFDTIGFCAIEEGIHRHTYTATSDVTVFSYPYTGFATIESLLREKEDVANLLVNSVCRQLTNLLEYRHLLKSEADLAYETIKKIHPLYEKLCTMYAFSQKQLPGVTDVAPVIDPVEDWLAEYYVQIRSTAADTLRAFFKNPGVSIGFMRRGLDDISRVLASFGEYKKQLAQTSKLLLDKSANDLFGLVSDLHIGSAKIKGADAAVNSIIAPLVLAIEKSTTLDKTMAATRLEAYRSAIGGKREGELTEERIQAGEKQNLAGSLGHILDYAQLTQEMKSKFTRQIEEFTALSDRNGSDDETHRLRRELSQQFIHIYTNVLMRAINESRPDTIIKMFLNFGYMDAQLAGFENADYLYSIADTMCGDPSRGVYTLFEWMKAIASGKKEPSRNEFDLDYPGYVAELKQQKRFDDKEEQRMLNDVSAKLYFELEQIFPVVNKLTFGRITTYFPIFNESNVLKKLDESLITADLLDQYFNEIRALDFSAFYRETSYSNPEIGIQRETVHVEIMPEVILMPNCGTRGIMWQDIEGRKRTTPSRMFMPLFILTDLKQLVIKLTGEFRWEMCKRIQGSRWNDMTDPSLTSEFCDYLQFYRTNRDLSSEVKQGVKSELERARKNYKAVFVQNYLEWLVYESAGSPRLNKFARKLLMTYCPFKKDLREKLGSNPQFADGLKKFNIKTQQRENLLARVVQKVIQTKGSAPQELLDELEFART